MNLILVALDGSDRSDRAIETLVGRLRDRPGARVELLYVHEPQLRVGRVRAVQKPEEVEAFREARSAQVLRDAAEKLRAAGIETGTRALQGKLYDTIAAVATEVSASEIVLGVRTPWLSRATAAVGRKLRPLEALRVPVTYPS